MNCPDPEIGGLIVGSHESWETRVSEKLLPASLERDSKVSMKKLPGWTTVAPSVRRASSRRSKYATLIWPPELTATYGWNWSAFVESWFTFCGGNQLAPPSGERTIITSACMSSWSPACGASRYSE